MNPLKYNRKNVVVVLADRDTGKKLYEGTKLFDLYAEYHKQYVELNKCAKYIADVTRSAPNIDYDGNIYVNRETFDRLYEYAWLMKLSIGLTYNEDMGLWFFTVEYRGHTLTFTNDDNRR